MEVGSEARLRSLLSVDRRASQAEHGEKVSEHGVYAVVALFRVRRRETDGWNHFSVYPDSGTGC